MFFHLIFSVPTLDTHNTSKYWFCLSVFSAHFKNKYFWLFKFSRHINLNDEISMNVDP